MTIFRMTVLIVCLLFMVSCQSSLKTERQARVVASRAESRIVGYFAMWNGVSDAYLRSRHLSHVIYAFAIPELVQGGQDFKLEAPALKKALTAIRARNPQKSEFKSMIAIGGWSSGEGLVSTTFEQIVSMQNGIERFSDRIVAICDELQLDGVDIDWEFPTIRHQQRFTELIRTLRNKMDRSAACHTLSVAVPTRPEDVVGFGKAWYDSVDFVNIMAYDYNGEVHHSSLEHGDFALDLWVRQLGLPADKAVLGIPFYAKPYGYSYAKILKFDSRNAERDEAETPKGTVYYNGESTVRKKTELGRRYGGVMIWDLGKDSRERPLLDVIEKTMGF